MGLSRAAIKLMAEAVKEHKLCGRVLVIGKQDVWGTERDVLRWLGESGLSPAKCKVLPSLKSDFQRREFIQDISLFQLMGFQEVVTMDNSAYEGAEIIHDLNLPLADELAAKLGSFDLVVDAGCLEHIFNTPQVLKNFHHLATDRGVVIHIAPSSNHVDHGLYMFSPTFFQDYYSANRWNILYHYFFQYSANYKAGWKIYQYQPGALLPISFGGLSRGLYGVFIVARKQDGSTFNANVQQGIYLAAWAEDTELNNPKTFKNKWRSLREQLKPHIPKALVPLLILAEVKVNAVGGVSRYLKHYKTL